MKCLKSQDEEEGEESLLGAHHVPQLIVTG
jgi:hypothetical protein